MKVLLIEDSISVRAYVEGVLRQAPNIEVLPSAADGKEGVKAAIAYRPDLVLMDIELPTLDGISAIAEIMERAPCPIVVLSAHLETPGQSRAFMALEAGAVDVLAKPVGLSNEAIDAFAGKLLATIRLMSQARVVRRRPSGTHKRAMAVDHDPTRYSMIVIGASTGGPAVLRQILMGISSPSPLPIVIAQHTIVGFEQGLATWLEETGHRVEVTRQPTSLRGGVVYLAPADAHIVVGERRLELESPSHGQAPSVDLLFESAARTHGARALGVLLTGMGADGAAGMRALRQRGALTVTQSASTCVVNGMPEAARQLDASVMDLSPAEIAALIAGLTRRVALAFSPPDTADSG